MDRLAKATGKQINETKRKVEKNAAVNSIKTET